MEKEDMEVSNRVHVAKSVYEGFGVHQAFGSDHHVGPLNGNQPCPRVGSQ